jgi:toxin YoeB
MGKFIVEIKETAEADLLKHKKSGNKSTISRILKILDELAETPYNGIGNPEKLKYDLQDYWSRRLNKKDRMIYKVDEQIVTVFVFSAIGHYGDK